MKRHLIVRVVSLVLVFAILLQTPALIRQSEGTFERWLEGLNRPVQAEGLPGASLASQTIPQRLDDGNRPVPKAETAAVTLFAPAVRTPLGPPDFEIIAPAGGWTVSGTLFFAVQARVPRSVSSVTFLAGSTTLGTDNTPDDGYRVFLDAGAFPAGPLTLTAQASGPAGQASQSVTVNVVPNPPASGVIGSAGGVLASEIGSTITFPPGALPNGTGVTVDELTQAEVAAQNGINWEALGVTFLGAQEVQTGAAAELPFRVSSAGFGNKVQPGQTVVNYRLIPDVDGDGVDEIVVANTASVAPNDDVISDPVPQIFLDPTVTVNRAGVRTIQNQNAVISGPPGTVIEMEASGFNPYSVLGNVAIFYSSVDSKEISVPISVRPHANGQTLIVVIPWLLEGSATLTLRNESTGSTTGPFDVLVQASPPLSKPAKEIIDDFLAFTVAFINQEASTASGHGLQLLQKALGKTKKVQDFVQEISVDPSPEEEQVLIIMATMIENSDLNEDPAGFSFSGLRTSSAIYMCTAAYKQKVENDKARAGFIIDVGLTIAGYGAGAGNAPIFGAGVLLVGVGWLLSELAASQLVDIARDCEGIKNACLAPSTLSNIGITVLRSAPPGFVGAGADLLDAEPPVITGMGSAPPPGGNSCGNVAFEFEEDLAGVRSGSDLSPGRFVVKVISGGTAIPFTGLTDPGGYFFIPLIPEGQPFTALAIDTQSGEVRTFEDVGPPFGESVLMFFDFMGEGNANTPIEFGEVVTGEIASLDELDVYSFTGNSGDRIFMRASEGGPIPGPFGIELTILRPDSTQLCSTPNSNYPESLCTLDSTGTHVLLVGDDVGDGTGAYSLYVQRTNNPANPVPINFGEAGSGAITNINEIDTYTFAGNSGDQLFMRTSEGEVKNGPFGPEFTIYRPDGSQLCSATNTTHAESPCTLDSTGTYVLLIGEDTGDATGEYFFYVQRTNNPTNPVPINFGDAGSGAITNFVEMDTYTFAGNANDRVVVRAYEGFNPFNIYLRIFRPDGTLLCSIENAYYAELGCTLNSAGTHTLLIGDHGGNAIANYQWYLQRTNNPGSPTAINLGDTLNGATSNIVAMNTYTLAGTAGASVLYRVTQTAGAAAFTPEFRVYRPNGTMLCDTYHNTVAEEVCAFDTSGPHAILVGDENGTYTGSYNIHVEAAP